jgi:predicted aspartyl protease
MNLLGQFVAEFDVPNLSFVISSPTRPRKTITAVGIIDTGASRLCIPQRLALQAGLRPIRTIPTSTASGVVLSTVYAAKVEFLALNYCENIEVIAPQTDEYEAPILIGMSVLRQFNIWYHGGLGTWSFYRHEGA